MNETFVEPLAAMPHTIVAHALVMATTLVFVVPCGVGLALRRSPAHKYVEAAAFALLCGGLSLALASGAPHPTPKRHYGTAPHVHADTHATVGMVSLAIMALSGTLAVCGRGVGTLRTSTRSLHRAFGVLLAAAFAFQLVSGTVAVFALETLSGVDQTIGHFGPALALVVGGVLALRRRHAHDSELHALVAEAALVLGTGVAATLYSLYSEWPYTGSVAHVHHLVVSLALLVGGGGTLRTLTTQKRRLPHDTLRRALTSTVFAAVASGMLMLAHPQHSAYASALHKAFGVALLAAAVARGALAWRTLSATMFVAAALFVASQRGAARLHTMYYVANVSIGGVIVLVTVAGLVVYAYALTYEHLFLSEQRRADDVFEGNDLTRRIDELVDSE